MEENKIEIESEETPTPENKFACLGIPECQQVLERLKGVTVVDSLPYSAKALMDEFKDDKDTLRREVAERKDELERYRKKAVDLHIAKKYAAALEGYDEYFAKLGPQAGDYEAEQLRKECRRYVLRAKKRKWQAISAAVIVVVLLALGVDQILFRQNIRAFQAALQEKDYGKATETAIKISWRYDTEAGISNLVCFLDERDAFNQLCTGELNRSSLDNYGGIKWQQVLESVAQADVGEDLPQAIQQVRQASDTTEGLLRECMVLEQNERDFNAMYESSSHKDAAHYAQEKWEQLEQLREMEITQTNLQVITDRYELMLQITNQVSKRMDAQEAMQPVKDRYEAMAEKEKIKVNGILNYTSPQLDEALRWAGVAVAKEERFEFVDARYLYSRAIESIEESQKEREEDAHELDRIEQARLEFNSLYESFDVGLAQERFPKEWADLSAAKKDAEAEYEKTERWNSDAFARYRAAAGKLRQLVSKLNEADQVGQAKQRFDRLFATLNIGLAEKWFPDQWNELFAQKKKADAAYERGDQWEDVNVCYAVASQKLEDLLVEICGKAKNVFNEMYDGIDDKLKGILEKSYPADWGKMETEKAAAIAAYAKSRHWEGDAYEHYIEAARTLSDVYNKAQEEKKFIPVFDMSGYEEAMKPISEFRDQSSGSVTNVSPR